MTDELLTDADGDELVAGPVPTVPGLVVVTAWGARAHARVGLPLFRVCGNSRRRGTGFPLFRGGTNLGVPLFLGFPLIPGGACGF